LFLKILDQCKNAKILETLRLVRREKITNQNYQFIGGNLYFLGIKQYEKVEKVLLQFLLYDYDSEKHILYPDRKF
jgi:hypothetical protein